jgi:DNA-binding HxlR family transcriptional regulator
MAGKRSYDDPCGVARALGVIGERWALLVIRELVYGPKRFSDLSRGLPGISQNVLAQRLRELEAAGVLHRVRLGPPAATSGYELTERGTKLERVLLSLGEWGRHLPMPESMPQEAQLSVDALVLALRTAFEPEAAGDLRMRCELRIGDDRFFVDIAEDGFHAARGSGLTAFAPGRPGAPDAVLTAADPGPVRALAFAGRPLADAEQAGEVDVAGDRAALERLLGCFPQPVPV